MEQLVRPFAQILEQLGSDGVALGALDQRIAVRFVQASGALLLDGDEAVGLARAADTAGLAGHDLHQVIIRRALLDVL